MEPEESRPSGGYPLDMEMTGMKVSPGRVTFSFKPTPPERPGSLIHPSLLRKDETDGEEGNIL